MKNRLLFFVFVVLGLFTPLLVVAADFTLHSDIAYGENVLQKMDVYAPQNVKNAPVIFMVHGGAWAVGDKSNGNVVKNKVAYWVSRGFVFISVNYRLLPESGPVQQEEDIVDALVYSQQQAAQWGGDKSKFILMGHSAGAHLIALLSANPSPALAKGAVLWKGSVFLDSAALDVPAIMQWPHYSFYDDAFGKDVNYWQKTSPYHQLQKNAAPMLLVCSTKRLRSCNQAEKFSEKAKSLGVSAQITRQDLTHEQINETLGLSGDYTRTVSNFISAAALK